MHHENAVERAVGIDLGTTNSLVAHAVNGTPAVLANQRGHRKTPSVVARTDDGFLVGRKARNRLVSAPERTIASVKRYMGDDEQLSLGAESYTPSELSAAILQYLHAAAEATLEATVTEAVVTVPAYFDHRQRIATKEAAELADIEVLRLVNEPTAACLAYGLREHDEHPTVLVYDLGGGTFDVSIVDLQEGVFEVLGTDGDDQLGGDDWDGAIVDWLLERIETAYDVSVPEPVPLQLEERLFEAARSAKHELSSRSSTTIRVPFLEVGDETIDLETTLTREQFEAMTEAKLRRTIEVATALERSVAPGAIDEIILVGGSTRMPMVREALVEAFEMEPRSGVNPDEAVALGAAIQAELLASKGLPGPGEREGDRSPVPKPEEDDAGLPDDVEDVVLIDSTPKALGVEAYWEGTDEKHFSTVIPRHAPIPTRETRSGYYTREDYQQYVTATVLQSKTATLEDAAQLDEFEIGPVPKRPAGEIEFTVEFTLTEDGTLAVHVTDAEGFAEASIEITSAVETPRSELEQRKRRLPDVVND